MRDYRPRVRLALSARPARIKPNSRGRPVAMHYPASNGPSQTNICWSYCWGSGGEDRRMDAEDFRAMAERCRELGRVAVRDDVRRQLRQWERDFEAEAEAVEKRSEEARF